MNIEYEATFCNIEKDTVREQLRHAGATLVRPEFLQKRIPFHLPNPTENAWLRVRDEDGIVTMSLKRIDGNRIEDQKEICLSVDSFNNAVNLLEAIGCQQKSFQESKRELWRLNGVDITIDEWPFLEPFVEVEGGNEDVVRTVSEKIGFTYAHAQFCAVGELYRQKYGTSVASVNALPKLVFDMENPFSSAC